MDKIEKKHRRKLTKETIDAILFYVIGAFFPVFTLPQIFNVPLERDYHGSTMVLELFLIIPAFIAFLVLSAIYLNRTKDREHKKNTRIVLIFYSIYVILKTISVFSFPYGLTVSEYTSPFSTEVFHITYNGMYPQTRVATYLSDLGLFGVLAVLFSRIKEVRKKPYQALLDIIFYVMILVSVVMILFAIFLQGKDIINNIQAIFKGGHFSLDIKSFTPHHNVFGFFLMFAGILCLYFVVVQNRVPFFFLAMFFDIMLFIISSKSPFFLLSMMLVLCSIFYPIFRFEKHKGTSIFFIVLNGLILLAIFFVLIFKGKSFIRILDHFTDSETIHTRIDLIKVALEMFSVDKMRTLFGYTKAPFLVLFNEFKDVLPVDHNVACSHNSFTDELLQQGLLITLLSLAVLLYILLKDFIALGKRKDPILIFFIATWVILTVYSCVEPRMFYYYDGTNIYFLFFLVAEKIYVLSKEDYHSLLVQGL